MRFGALWPHLSLISVIDIFLVAVIIYELLALIQGTRAAYMLVGVAAVVHARRLHAGGRCRSRPRFLFHSPWGAHNCQLAD